MTSILFRIGETLWRILSLDFRYPACVFRSFFLMTFALFPKPEAVGAVLATIRRLDEPGRALRDDITALDGDPRDPAGAAFHGMIPVTDTFDVDDEKRVLLGIKKDHVDDFAGRKMKLWTEREICALTNADLLPRCASLAMQSDIARYEILYREGGVYLDTDMECRKPIDMLIANLDFFACWQKKGVISNAIFGCVKGHKLLQQMVWGCRKEFKTDRWDSMGPPYFTPKVLAHPGAKIFDRETFIPFTREEYARFPKKPMVQVDAPPTAYAVNHRASLWYKDSTAALAPKT